MISRHTVQSSVAIAMQNSIANMRNSTGAFGHHVKSATQRGVGKISRSDWNARLRARTAQKLIDSGILPSH